MESELRKKLPPGGFVGVSEARSAAMRAVRSRGNKATERRLRSSLVARGIRGWRMHAVELAGTPDFVFPKAKVVVFVDGCFWHGCPQCGHLPRTRSSFWRAKIERNQQRDKASTKRLRKSGYVVLRFWECQLKAALVDCLSEVAAAVETGGQRRPVK